MNVCERGEQNKRHERNEHLSQEKKILQQKDVIIEYQKNLRQIFLQLSASISPDEIFHIPNSINENLRLISKLKTEIDQLQLMMKSKNMSSISINEFYRLSENLSDAYLDTQKRIMGAIQLAEQEKLSPRLASSKAIIEAYEYLQYKLPQVSIPTPVPFSQTFYQLFPSLLRKQNNTIYIDTIFPLYNQTYFELYKIYSVPIPRKELPPVYISPKKHYIAVNYRNSEYMLLTKHQLEECSWIKNTIFCDDHTEILLSPTCEFSLLTNLPTDFTTCTIEIASQKYDSWIYLDGTNTWIYSLTRPVNTRIVCKEINTTIITLNGVGLLTLQHECEAITKDLKISPPRNSKPFSGYYDYNCTIPQDMSIYTSTSTHETKMLYLEILTYILILFAIVSIIIQFYTKRTTKKRHTSTIFYRKVKEPGQPTYFPFQRHTEMNDPIAKCLEHTNLSNTSPKDDQVTIYQIPSTPKPLASAHCISSVSFNLSPESIKRKNSIK